MAVSFQEVYERYAGDVFRFALYLSGNRADAEDLTAETFVRLWTAQDVRGLTVKAYLLAIARNLHLERLRRERPSRPMEETLPDNAPSPEVVTVDRDRARRFAAACRHLPESDQSALFMRALEGLSYEDIARALKLSVGNAKVKVHRARRRVAAILNEENAR